MLRPRKRKVRPLLLWLLLFILHAGQCCGQLVDANTSTYERNILLLLKKSIDNWFEFRSGNNLHGWDGSPTCTWSGVTCASSSLVTQLDLGCYGCKRQAIGSLLPDLGNFTALQKIDLSNQYLTGPLPESWSNRGMMGQLMILNLSFNRLTGTLPAWSDGSSLPKLESLILNNNQLTGTLPPIWGDASILPEITVLHLENNNLIGELPVEWAEDVAWPGLRELGLSNNNLTGTIPAEWVKAIPSLETLTLADNNLGGAVPGAFGEESSPLQILDLSRNEFDGNLPANWSTDGTSNLTELYLNDCDFVGTLPASWGNPETFPSLQVLALQNNRLEGGLPPEWSQQGAFPQLQSLNLANNWLLSTIEPTWGDEAAFPALHSLLLQFNSLCGALPAEWGQNGSFASLQVLDLTANYLTGTLPASWGTEGALPQLTNLSLAWNRLSGSIPSSWGNLESLTTFWVQPGNYQLCQGLPADSHATMCKNLGNGCVQQNNLGSTCTVQPPSTAVYLPPSDALTGMRAILRLQNSSTISPSIGQGLASALLYVMTSAQTLKVVELAHTGEGPKSFTSPSQSKPRALLSTGATRGSEKNRRKLLHSDAAATNSSQPELLDAVIQFSAANGSTVYKMEEQLLTLLNSRALLNILGTSGVGLTAIDLLAAEPASDADLPGWWDYVPAWSPNNVTQSASSPSVAATPGSAAQADSSGSHVSVAVVVICAIAGFVTLVAALSFTWLARRRRARRRAEGKAGKEMEGNIDEFTSKDGCHGTDIHASSRNLSARIVPDSPDTSSPAPSSGAEGSSPAFLVLQRRREKYEAPRGLEANTGTGLKLPLMPWSDWEIDAAEIQICRRPSGQLWELGSGSFGKVYKAMRSSSQPVAVKILHDREDCLGFEQEIALLKACRHSNIVAFQGVCIQEGRTMLVTEFMEGGDLFRALSHPSARKMLQWNCCGRNIALDIARGLHFLHTRSVVHFDLKSHNILLSREGTAKVTDVGLARIASDQLCGEAASKCSSKIEGSKGYISKLDSIIGTFVWAAPELLLGVRCSEKVDIYSFGVLLWELAVTSHTGDRPQRGRLRPVRVPEELPEEIEELRQDCMETDPKLRPSAREVYDRLAASRL